jgi:5-methylcytosine-specific restriction protein B
VLTRLNREIGDWHYQIGPSFFLRDNLTAEIEDIWRMEIEPYLEELFLSDRRAKADDFSWEAVRDEVLG